ncbi:MAG: glycosyltransferase [Pseudomonadota bacterium]
MNSSRIKILYVNQLAGRGGAAGICLALQQELLAEGHESAVLVGRQACELPGAKLIEHDRYRSVWGRFWMAAARWLIQYNGHVRGVQRVSERLLPRLASTRRFWSWWAGYEDFDFPGTRHLLVQSPFMPDILHLHNLHGDYFDLRELPRLSRAVPTIITLHDAWLLAGHCAHSFDCERWKIGCGSCQRLDILPTLRRDGTAYNWQRKQEIYHNSRFLAVCPSHWLADKVRQSMLMAGVARLRVIPNGVDTSVFKPGDKVAARGRLGWPQEAFIVMFAANGVRQSIWKDYPTMREAIRLTGDNTDNSPIRFFAIGDTAPAEQAGTVKIEFLPYRNSMTECYQAADVYLHAARADTFPSTIIESLACGTPVVATAVGGISEQIIEGETGYLVPAGDAMALAKRLVRLVQSPNLVSTMGTAASRDAANRFSLRRMALNYMHLYQEEIKQRAGAHGH